MALIFARQSRERLWVGTQVPCDQLDKDLFAASSEGLLLGVPPSCSLSLFGLLCLHFRDRLHNAWIIAIRHELTPGIMTDFLTI